jgi:hypothetical protein
VAEEPFEEYHVVAWPARPAPERIYRQSDAFGAEMRQSAAAARPAPEQRVDARQARIDDFLRRVLEEEGRQAHPKGGRCAGVVLRRQGVVMHPDGLRAATAKPRPAGSWPPADRRGEKRNRKRMCEVAAVFDVTMMWISTPPQPAGALLL